MLWINYASNSASRAGFSSAEANALYGQLSGKYVTLTTLPVTISTAIATAVLPSIAASVKLREKKQVRRKMALTYRVSMIISVPAAVGISALGPQIIQMLFPSASDGGMLLTVMAVTVFDVPVKGSFPVLLLSSVMYAVIATGMGLLFSSVTSLC